MIHMAMDGTGTYSFVASCEGETVLSYIAANNGGVSPANDSTVVAGDYYLESSEVFTLVFVTMLFLVVWMKQHSTITLRPM